MTLPLTVLARLLGLGVVVALAAVHAPVTNAQAGTGPHTPVLVIIDDSNGAGVRRSSDIARRVVGALGSALPRYGLRMVDGESVARDLGWRISDRLARQELTETLKAMSGSPEAQHFHRASLMLKAYAQAVSRSFGDEVRIRIQGEIWRFDNAATGEFLDTVDLPSSKFVAPKGCMDSSSCISRVVGDRAVELAPTLAEVFARKVERHIPRRPRSASSESNGSRVVNRFRVTLRSFEDIEALTIMGTMADEFPGYQDLGLINSTPGLRSYDYQTTATAAKLDEWFAILLTDMGFEVARDVVVTIEGNEVAIEKLLP